jgi:hypothetical protein
MPRVSRTLVDRNEGDSLRRGFDMVVVEHVDDAEAALNRKEQLALDAANREKLASIYAEAAADDARIKAEREASIGKPLTPEERRAAEEAYAALVRQAAADAEADRRRAAEVAEMTLE